MKNLLLKLKAIHNANAIYTINGYSDLKYLLSVHDPSLKSIVIAPSLVAKCPLIEKIFGADKVVVIPDGLNIVLPLWEPREWPAKMWPFVKTSILLRVLLFFISKNSRGVIFNDFNSFSGFILTATMRKHRQQVHRIDVLPWLRVDNSSDEAIFGDDQKFQFLLKFLGFLVGTKLVEVRYGPDKIAPIEPSDSNIESAVGYGLPDNPDCRNITILSWQEIVEKYPLPKIKPKNPAVLLIDTPFSEFWPDVDQAKTYQTVLNYLKEAHPTGTELHIKLHYRDIDDEKFKHIDKESNNIKLLTQYIPVEIFMQYYQNIYYFLSSGALESCDGQKYSLFPLITFSSDLEKKRFRSTQLAISQKMPEPINEVAGKT
ncbi:hypothetical protein N9L49_02280 [Rhodospirillales bacterium]|nr:hypothetical protein [Rhodospirillales bacterium]